MQRQATLPLLRRWRALQLARQQHQPPVPASSPFSVPSRALTAAAAPLRHADVVDRVAAALERLGVKPGRDAEVCDGLMTVDLAFISPAAGGGSGGHQQQKVAVDVTPRDDDNADDGPAATGGRPRPAQTPQRAWALMQARRHALQAHGWHYVNLPLVELVGVMGSEAEEDALVEERVLAAAADAAAKPGHVCGSGCNH
jgi:hypothetical protein